MTETSEKLVSPRRIRDNIHLLPLVALVVLHLMTAGATPVWAAELSPGPELATLSLEDLMTLEVTSAARKSQSVANTAAAIFVITQEDIRRSGVTNIPDALRMVPGVTVAKIDSSKWAVTARGFNGRFARKLLVLIDGRSIYTPLFSGVFWDVQDTLLEDIERIEVIRGPGATIWGANAVNGVINIITKQASDTTGGLISAASGNYDRGNVGARYGASLGEWGAMRAYGKYVNRFEQKTEDNRPADDGWDQARGGFRLDGKSGANSFTLQGDIYGGTERETFTLPDLSSATFSSTRTSNTKVGGGNILSKLTHSFSDDSELSFQLYYDRTMRNMPGFLDEKRNTVDVDMLHRFQWGKVQDIVWGLGYRFTEDRISGSHYLSLTPQNRSEKLFSAFLQDDITVIQDRVHLVIGSKFEHNDYTGFEVQPSGRLIWTPNEHLTFWSAVSRAVHTPSRGESDVTLQQSIMLTQLGPTPIVIQGPGNLLAEELMAYEAGIRIQPVERFTVDLTGFYNIYRRLVGVTTLLPSATQPYILNMLRNNHNGETWGAELAADWRVLAPWRLAAAYSYITASNAAGFKPPAHQVSLRSQLELTENVELDVWGRFVDQSEDYLLNKLAGYVTLDVRLGWRPVKNLEVSLVGRNLLHQRQQEFRPEFINTLPSSVGREVYGKITWSF
ncbi:MAG: TonB-dependent receptor [Desulfuromonadales bacterium]|nr:TonB-dependent receptor [Desulfuromonadales bacterium]